MDKSEIESLAGKVQQAVASYDPSDSSSWIPIQDAIEELRRATEPPHVFLMKQRFHIVQNIYLVAAVDMGLFKILSARAGESVTASDLAGASGYDKALTGTCIAPRTLKHTSQLKTSSTNVARIMRMIIVLGLATETGYQSYRTNARTIYPDWKQAFNNNKTPRNKSFSVPWHSKYPERDRLPPPFPTKPEQLLKPFTIVDIGGSQGVDLQRFATAFPEVPCEMILQDFRETVNGIPSGLDSRIRPMVYDFFTPQPVEGADLYYPKLILHDWNDEAARKILSNTAQVMGPHSRLLINEMVLADTGETLAWADMDMLMWLLCNGMERTRQQWEELLGRVAACKLWRYGWTKEQIRSASLRLVCPDSWLEAQGTSCRRYQVCPVL
ncbi:S-adenosyl-L-methionine-dependent methyltransferase [Aspergillus fijiensis CBS 313.89]|uniref:S-adenosyl-L-methionine-dependent methyltransferase n=1 Tax=Aspergillus fijiensis CBS 313.89 TaxID=1448319 RepID=A0A8G1S2F5_9EURO|nr:S-adenosyl-L-methionine-dependent methyltransferase [Aspergillus fijiensis CBS 313.89]RAK82196.1 S-adenosyl-L-methionine-dependent methyltransferase [Aspergillus fijiensis CBS 313.89]